MVLLPGLWHYLWHTQMAAFRLAGDWFLIDFALLHGRSTKLMNTKGEVRDFHATSRFMLNLAESCLKYINYLKDEFEPGCSVFKFMAAVGSNRPLYNLVWVTMYLLLPYARTVEAIRAGNANLFCHLARHWAFIFMMAHKVNPPPSPP